MSSSAVFFVLIRSPFFFSLTHCDSDNDEEEEEEEEEEKEEEAEDGSLCKMRDDTGKGFGEFSASLLPGGSSVYAVGPSAKKRKIVVTSSSF
jgi:hypothetical protein